jgi:hypothetical protein
MRWRRQPGTVCNMSTSDVAQPHLDVDLRETTPLRGVVRCGAQAPRPFEGWIELATAIQACMQAEETPDSSSARRSA